LLYAHVATAIRRRWPLGAALLIGSALHAGGHAFLAAAAGALTRALAVGPGASELGLVRARGALVGEAILPLAVAGVVAALAKLVGGALAAWAEARVAGDVAAAVRLRVLDDVLSLHWRGAAPGAVKAVDHGSGRRLAALTTHVHDVEQGVARGVLAEVRAIVQLLPLLVLLVVLAPRLAGTAVVALLAFGGLAFALRRAFKRAHARAVASSSQLIGAADEVVRHAELWATYGAERRVRAHVAVIGRSIAREAASLRVRASVLSSTSEVLGALALVLVLLLVARGAFGVNTGTVVPFAITFFMAYRPLRELVDARLARARGEEALAAALPRVDERHSETPPQAASPATRWTLQPLVLSNVGTAHGAHAPVSLRVPPGSIVAIVGPTGVGKTSLLRALLGLDRLASGEIGYGDRVLGAARVGPNERPFAWVPQDVPVVADTLAVNVGLGQGDANEEEDPSAVLGDLGAYGLAEALGDDVLVADRLSGGERQWVAVARAFATGLPVRLLDVPTSALDASSQASILSAIRRLRGRRTVILVTHRPEPLAVADIVVRLEAESRSRRDQGARTSSVGPAVTSIEAARKSSPSRT
jgi:ABC-type multidrug transport system fused ATPase/permease subunit